MTAIDQSWDFLRDFYQSDTDRSIVNLINKAIGIHSDKSLRDDSYEIFMADFLSLLPIQIRSKSYQDFLDYVNPIEDEPMSIIDKENAFLTKIEASLFFNTFTTISLVLFVLKFVFKKIKEEEDDGDFNIFNILNQIPKEKKPYCFLYVYNLNQSWFLFDGNSRTCFPNKKTELLFRFLRNKFDNSQKKRKLHKKWWNRFKKSRSRDSQSLLSAEQLYPMVTLLIVLRQEWKDSMMTDDYYINEKYKSWLLLNKHTSKKNLNDALIYGLYQKFGARDQEIIDHFDRSIQPVEFHPLVAKHIIESFNYGILFKNAYIFKKEEKEESGETVEHKDEWFEYIETKLDKDRFNGKRLLLDFIFPYTIVRDDDVFLKTDSLSDRIYLSLMIGNNYQDHWRDPKPDERFDYIQIAPTRTSYEYDSSRVIGYQKFLAPAGKGEFLVVKSEKDYELENHIMAAFSDFRHDLKEIRMNLSTELFLLQKKWDILDEIEQKERIDRIKDYYDLLNSYIAIAGNPKVQNKDQIMIVDFIWKYSRFIAHARNTGKIHFNVNDSAIQEDLCITFNKALLNIILNAIIDNAIEHGFNNFGCASPTIEFALADTEQYILLKICNNGRPIEVTSAVFKTRGVFAGPTGHTGLGGYLINKYVSQQGGYIEVLNTDKWNTEIHLYLKKDER